MPRSIFLLSNRCWRSAATTSARGSSAACILASSSSPPPPSPQQEQAGRIQQRRRGYVSSSSSSNNNGGDRGGIRRSWSSTSSSSAAAAAIQAVPATSRQQRQLRRRRQYEGKVTVDGNGPPRQQQQQPAFGDLVEPVEFGSDRGDDCTEIDEYLESTANLSPWVPTPDVVARRAFDLALMTTPDFVPGGDEQQRQEEEEEEEVHVDLGSGDGRVNFHAVDYARVRTSIGIDNDPKVLEVARQRLLRRHPQPDIRFVRGNLSDPDCDAWNYLDDATIVTMYFARPALVEIRPILERRLSNRNVATADARRKPCRVVTVGYEMPGWQASVQEVVLGTKINVYQFGGDEEEDSGGGRGGQLRPLQDGEDEEDDDFVFVDVDDEELRGNEDAIISERPEELRKSALEGKEFEGSKVIDHTGKYPIRGFNPDIFRGTNEEEDDDWDNEDDVEVDDGNGSAEARTSKDEPK